MLAIAVPMASAAPAGPSAFAASGNSATGTAAGATEGVDSDDQQMAANLDARVLDQRPGSDVSGVVLDADSDSILWDHNGSTAPMPASNVEPATSTAATPGPAERPVYRPRYGPNGPVSSAAPPDAPVRVGTRRPVSVTCHTS